MINWFIAVDYPYEEPHFTCFTTGTDNDSEIFSSHGEMGWEEGVFITNNNYKVISFTTLLLVFCLFL